MNEPEYFDYTPEGCDKAIKYLESNKYHIAPWMDGWEIVAWANEILRFEREE